MHSQTPFHRRLAALQASFAPIEKIEVDQREKNLKWASRTGIPFQIMDTLVAGVFLTAFAVQIGAPNILIGLFAALPNISNLVQLPTLVLVERMRKRKLISFVSTLVSRQFLFLLVAAALVSNKSTALTLITCALIGRYIFGAVNGCAWNSWHRELVPEERMGRYFGSRLSKMTGAGVITGIIASALIDYFEWYPSFRIEIAYGILFFIGYIVGSTSAFFLIPISEPKMGSTIDQPGLISQLVKPFSDKNFRNLMIFLGSWNFAVNLAAPFFTVHMLKRLDLNLLWIFAFTASSQIAYILFVRKWGSVADRFSNKSVLAVCGPVFIACIFGWTFTTMPDAYVLTLPLLFVIHVFSGASSAGVALASGNIAMKLAPRNEATSYLATNSVVNALAAGTAPIIGGLLADAVLNYKFSLVAQWQSPVREIDFNTLAISQWDFFFIAASIVGLFSIYRLRYVIEEGQVEPGLIIEDIVLSAKRSLANISSVSGLKTLTDFPFDLLKSRSNTPKDSENNSRRSSAV